MYKKVEAEFLAMGVDIKMSTSFVHTPKFHSGGIGPEEWMRLYWDSADFGPGDVGKQAVLFRDFKSVFGRAGAYMATPVAIVEYRAANLAVIDKKYKHPVAREHDVLVPLGMPNPTCKKANTVLQQCARQWVTGGQNTGNMSDENVLTMYYSALQSLVFAAGNATTKEAQTQWFYALSALVRAFATLRAESPLFQKVTEAMVVTPGVDDMLQKALAHVFHPAAHWDRRVKLELLDVMARRNIRHGERMVGMAPGPFVVFALVPLLRSVAASVGWAVGSPAATQADFNAKAGELLQAYVGASTSVSDEMQINTLVALTKVAGCELTSEQANNFLQFARATPDMSVGAPWASWGALPSLPVMDVPIVTKRFDVGGRTGISVAAKVEPTSTSTCNVYGYKGIHWTGLQFPTVGHYVVTPHDLGIAVAGHGNTRGEELVANWRVTVGDDILPRDKEGYSSAGMARVCTGGRWSYVERTPLDVKKPFTLAVEKNQIVVVQNSVVYFRTKRVADAMLAFKNMWLSVQYRPAPTPAPAPPVIPNTPKPSPALAPGSSYAAALCAEPKPLDLPPAALIAQLRSLASKQSKDS